MIHALFQRDKIKRTDRERHHICQIITAGNQSNLQGLCESIDLDREDLCADPPFIFF